MRVFLTGGTGLIGRRLTQRLLDRGDTPVLLSRSADHARRSPQLRGIQVLQGDPGTTGPWETAIDGCDAVINLAGHGLFSERWNTDVKRKIRDSRIYSTENVVSAIGRAIAKPKVLVQASAIGFYGPHGDEDLDESSNPGSDFMAKVCREWEDSANHATQLGVRVTSVRTGIVLAKGASALGVMTPIFKWLPGGAAPIGSGSSPIGLGRGLQWMSWIHIDDIVGIFLLALDNEAANGPINGTAPNPVRNVDFSKALANEVHRPFLPIGPPDIMLTTLLGEVADVVTKGQKVLPHKAQKLGYHFLFSDVTVALHDLFKKDATTSQGKPVLATSGVGQ